MKRYHAIASALLLASVNVPSASFANPSGGDGLLVRHRLVRYNDLDLTTAAGVRALDRRIGYALNLVCSGYSGPSAAGSVDPDCVREGHRAVQPQIAVAIAQQKLARLGAESNFSIAGQEPDATHPPIP